MTKKKLSKTIKKIPVEDVSSAEESVASNNEEVSKNRDSKARILSAEEANQQKKKPGRPRKNPIRQPQKRKGIVSVPEDERNHIEFLYDNPEIFKKILSCFKSHAVNNIFITFKDRYILFWCEDNLQKNKIRIKINCSLINHYYCFETLNIGMSCDHLEKIMATIDKTYSSILILSQKDSIQNYIEIILKDDIRAEKSYKVELIGDYNTFHNVDHLFDDYEAYILNFSLSGKKFKAMINDMAAFTDQVSIELNSSVDPLVFQYRSRDNKIKHTTTFHNNAFSLRKNIDDGDTFHISFKLEYVKPISSSLISDYVKIFVDENRPLLFVNSVDGGCIEVHTLTEIIDKRKEIDLGAI